jgi:hypothetical protein
VDTYTGWGMAFTELNYGFQEDFRKELFLRQTLRQLPTLIMSYQDSGVVRWLEGNDQLAQLWGLQSGRNLSAVFSKIQQAHLMSVFSGHQQSQSFVVEDKVFHVYVSPHLPQTGLAFLRRCFKHQPHPRQWSMNCISSDKILRGFNV